MIPNEIEEAVAQVVTAVRDTQAMLRHAQDQVVAMLASAKSEIRDETARAVRYVREEPDRLNDSVPPTLHHFVAAAGAEAVRTALGADIAQAIAAGERDVEALLPRVLAPLERVFATTVPRSVAPAARGAALAGVLAELVRLQISVVPPASAPDSDQAEAR
jgi:hypothetical protein